MPFTDIWLHFQNHFTYDNVKNTINICCIKSRGMESNTILTLTKNFISGVIFCFAFCFVHSSFIPFFSKKFVYTMNSKYLKTEELLRLFLPRAGLMQS